MSNMNSEQLTALIDQRWEVLRRLLEMTERQRRAIEGERISELMDLLGEKQQPLGELSELSEQLRQTLGDDPEARAWDNLGARQQCRRRHEECQQMLERLMRLEAESEQALVRSRDSLGKQLAQQQAARHAAARYTGSDDHRSAAAGARLDLSSG